MGKSIVDTDELAKARKNFAVAENMLINDGNCIISTLNGVHSRITQSDIWTGDACDAFSAKLGYEINKLGELHKTIQSLDAYCGQVDGDLERYVRYLQALFGRQF